MKSFYNPRRSRPSEGSRNSAMEKASGHSLQAARRKHAEAMPFLILGDGWGGISLLGHLGHSSLLAITVFPRFLGDRLIFLTHTFMQYCHFP